MTIVDGFEQIYNVLKTCIETEMETDGLLEDVETFTPLYYEEQSIDEPVIWMEQQPTNVVKPVDITQTMELQTPFEFYCAVYESEIEDSVIASENLANRVALSITRNWLTVQSTLYGKRIIKNIQLGTYEPVGYVEISGKSDRMAVIGIRFDVIHIINWVLCCRQLTNNNED